MQQIVWFCLQQSRPIWTRLGTFTKTDLFWMPLCTVTDTYFSPPPALSLVKSKQRLIFCIIYYIYRDKNIQNTFRLIRTNLCIPTEKCIRQRNADVKVCCFQDLLLHLEQFISCECIITDVEEVINNWRTSLLIQPKHIQMLQPFSLPTIKWHFYILPYWNEKCWAHSPQRAASRQFTRCRHCTVARRLRIDVHNDNNNDDNDNAWQRWPLWPHGMGPIRWLRQMTLNNDQK